MVVLLLVPWVNLSSLDAVVYHQTSLELLAGTTSLSPLASIEGDTQANQSQQTSSQPATTATPATIVEAQGWVQTQDGKIALVASAPQTTPVATTVQANCQLAK